MLTITASLTPAAGTAPITAHFVSDDLTDQLYLQTTTTGLLEWATSNPQSASSFTTDIGGSTLNVETQDVAIDTQVASSSTGGSGGVTLQGSIFTNGNSLTIQGASLTSSDQLLAITGLVDTQGGNFTVSGLTNVTIGTPAIGTATALGATISTRSLGGGTNYSDGLSSGNSGAISVTVANPDPFNPFLNLGFNTPQITVEPDSGLYAQATENFTPGDITLKAANTNYVIDGLSFPSLGLTTRQSTVDFVDGSESAWTTVEGGNIDIEANSGDISAASAITSSTDTTSNDQFSQMPQWFGGFLNSGLQLASYLPGLNLLTIPLAVGYRNAASTVTVGKYTQIDASGNVTLNSTSTSDSEGQAIFTYNTQVGLAVSVMIAVTDAQTNVNSNANIDSTGGTVSVESAATTTAVATSHVGQNVNQAPDDDNNVALAFSVSVEDQTSTTTVNPSAAIVASGNVNVTASGTGANTTAPSTGTYVSGSAGIAAGVNVTINDVDAENDGTLISGATENSPTLKIDPIKDVDYTNSAFEVPPSLFGNLQTGDPFTYSSGDNGPIGGLTTNTVYYIIVPTTLTDEIQLAASLSDAEAGTYIQFQQYPTLQGGPAGNQITVPISDVDESTGTIVFDSDPGFTDGEQLTYQSVDGEQIGGLSDGTYYAIVNQDSPDTLQLSQTAPTQNAQGELTDGPAIQLNLDPVFTGFRQNIPVTLNPSGSQYPPDAIEFSFPTGFLAGDSFIYQGSGIVGLNDGVRYFVIPDASDPNVIQLSESYTNNAPGAVAPITTSGSATLTFDPSVQIDSGNNTVDMNFNYALAGTLPSGTSLTYYGALGTNVANLTNGATYYVIQDYADPTLMRLTTAGATKRLRRIRPGKQSTTPSSRPRTRRPIPRTWQAIRATRPTLPPPARPLRRPRSSKPTTARTGPPPPSTTCDSEILCRPSRST